MLICKWALEDDLILSLISIVICFFSCLFCSFSPFAFFFFCLSTHKNAGIICALALAEADRKVQRLLRVGGEEDENEGGGERETT